MSTGPSTSRPPAALYIHVPFCVSLCPYCDFVVIAGSATRGPTNKVDRYLAALRRELELRADALDATFGLPGTAERPALESVYLGGGTPSIMPAEAIAALLERVRGRYGLADGAEVTLEANPGPDERGDPAALLAAGVNRISFGAQSLDDTELRRLGRRHRARHVAEAVANAREAGFSSINVDLLYDIPDTDHPTWMTTLDRVLEMAPEHCSLYALALDDPDAEGLTGPFGDHLPMTRGARRWRDGVRPGQDEDRAAAQYHHAVVTLGAAGYRGYEISNWAQPGHESRHNLAYWMRRPHEALGPGAHAFDGHRRRWNAARLDGYLAAVESGALPPGGVAETDPADEAAEALILTLRLDSGVPLATAYEPPLADHFGWALAAELLTVTDDDRVVLTTRGRLLSNELFQRLV
uniref:Coproporphyrinogen III oxidase anaerobic n=1 Tax=uncultured bacterium 148 TaxID=698380 RepID=E3T6P9_9BACT|nr:coproporphyrinogen III oxidase anaerobic [uncultured bacterium 148]